MTEPVVRRALISVSDKTGLVDFARFLAESGVALLSTGGSARVLRDAGLDVTDVARHTGFPEMLDGRVKTLHPVIHGGLLGVRNNPAHQAAMEDHGISPIDLVAAGAGFDDCIENIDIGGPALIRAAAKNHRDVTVVVDAQDYGRVMAAMRQGGGATDSALRRDLAAIAYARTGAYDAAIAQWFALQLNQPFPTRLAIGATLQQSLRYGENPHQQAALYRATPSRPGVASARQLQGKELSFNNINDTDAAFELVAEFDRPAVAIIKHANPCGVAIGTDLASAYQAALACDPVSAFGGVIAVNRRLDAATAAEIVTLFTEVVIAPSADDDAIALFAAKKNLRLLLTDSLPDPAAPGMTLRSIAGGYLLQSRDNGRLTAADLKLVSRRPPTATELADLLFAFRVAKHVKSNAIVYAKAGATVGIGAGQMSRIDSSRIAAWKSSEAATAAGLAQPAVQGSVVASDAFFPFADGLLAAAEAGATAVIQPGGSIKDAEVIAAADAKGLAMVFTGMRHFRH
jgi:phosphoribosylaminoimidazolecarboxamide formyltransferase/IMP cyclohydrolase